MHVKFSSSDICTINKDTPLIEAMRIFLTKRVSALPVIDNEGHVVDIYAKFDGQNLLIAVNSSSDFNIF